MPKVGTTLPERLAMLRERCGGSRRALSRLLGISDMTIKYWEAGATPLPSKLRKASQRSGIAIGWLEKGEGNTEKELAKCREVTVDEAEIGRIAEAAPTIHDAISFITQHGDQEDVQMLEELLNATQTRIRKRKAGKPGTKYQ